jgi:Tol biopolymer transport system component
MRVYRFRVFVAAADSSDLRRIDREDALEAGYPRWDPDGRSLTYLSWPAQRTGLYTPYRVWLDRLDEPIAAADRLQPLLPPECGYRASARSPGGRLIAAVREGIEDVFGFALLTPDGAVQELCAREYAYVVNPTWSPDGTAIAFCATDIGEGATTGLDVFERATRVIRRLGGVGYHHLFSWCPDSERLYVIDDADAGCTLYLVGRDGGERRHLCVLNEGDPSGEMDPASPAWSPDGRRLAVSTIPGGQAYSVIDLFTTAGLAVGRVAWPDAALLRIDDLGWQPSHGA